MSKTLSNGASQFLARFTLVRGFDSDSASRTDILEIEDRATKSRYIMKCFITEFLSYDRTTQKYHTEIPLSTDLLLHELSIYLSLRKQLIENPTTNVRNILCVMGDGQFTQQDLYDIVLNGAVQLTPKNLEFNIYRNQLFLLRLGKEKKRYAITKVEQGVPAIRPDDLIIPFGSVDVVRLDKPIKYAFFMTPKIDQGSLADAVESDSVKTLPELMQYLFVIVITLMLMSTVGVNQNDLHWGNILLSKSYFGPSPYHKRIYFMVIPEEDRVILVDNPGIPLIYDFDRAVTIHKASKEFHDYIMSGGGYLGGNCVHFNPKRDFLKTLCCLWHYCGNLKIPEARKIREEIMNELIWDDEIRDAIRRSHRGCWLTSSDEKYSLLCIDAKVDKGMASRDTIVKWVSKYCAFKTCTLKELREANMNGPANVRSMIEKFKSDMTSRHISSVDQLNNTIRSNIQIVGGAAREKLLVELTAILYKLL